MLKREELTTEDEVAHLGKKKYWSAWTDIYKTVDMELNAPGLYEQSIMVNKERIIVYLGKTNSTIGERFSSYIKNGSHLKRFYKQFKEAGFGIEVRWKEFTSMSTRSVGEDRPKIEESKILAKVDYILNYQENNKRRIDDLNKLIGDEKKFIIVDKIEVKQKLSEETAIKKKKCIEEDKMEKTTISSKGKEKTYTNSKGKEKTVIVDEENYVLKKDGTRDKRYKKAIV